MCFLDSKNPTKAALSLSEVHSLDFDLKAASLASGVAEENSDLEAEGVDLTGVDLTGSDLLPDGELSEKKEFNGAEEEGTFEGSEFLGQGPV